MKKTELSISKQNQMEVVRYNLGAADVYDEKAATKAEQIGCIVPFQYQDEDGKRSITAYVHEDTSLDAFMKKTLTKKEVLCIMNGLASVFEIGAQGIPVSYIIRDMSCMYVDQNTFTVKALLIPVKQDVLPLAEIPQYFKTVLSEGRFDETDTDNYVARLFTLLNAADFSVVKLKTFVQSELEKNGLYISKENGPTNISAGGTHTAGKNIRVNKVGVMNNMRPPVNPQMGQPVPPAGPQMNRPVNPQMGQPVPPAGPQMNRPVNPQMGQPVPPAGPQMNRPVNPQMGQPVPPAGPQMNRPMNPQMGQPVPPAGPQMNRSVNPQMGQPVPPAGPQMNRPMNPQMGQPVPPAGPQMNRPMNPQMGQPVPPAGPQMNRPMNPQMGQPVPPAGPQMNSPVNGPIMANSAKPLDEEKKNQEPGQAPKSSDEPVMPNLVGQLGTKPVPHLVRKKTGEIINITKSGFAIGKSKTKADYAIEDNTAISRVHCVIIQKDGVNYIKDNNSTNHTYVDGVELQPGREVLLKNKTIIQLGDEEFTFLLRKGE